MPTITRRFSMLTGTTVENALAGSQYEFAPFNAVIEVGMFTDADLVTAAVFTGPDVLVEPGSNVQFGTIRLPNYPDDYSIEDEVAAGDRMKVQLVNGSAGTRIVFVTVRITPK